MKTLDEKEIRFQIRQLQWALRVEGTSEAHPRPNNQRFTTMDTTNRINPPTPCKYCGGAGQYMDCEGMPRLCEECQYPIPAPPECEECGKPLEHERIRIFDDGACHVWSCENADCGKWALIINTDATPKLP